MSNISLYHHPFLAFLLLFIPLCISLITMDRLHKKKKKPIPNPNNVYRQTTYIDNCPIFERYITEAEVFRIQQDQNYAGKLLVITFINVILWVVLFTWANWD